MAPRRRKNPIASRRRVEDEGEEDGGPDAVGLDDDSLTEGSIISDDEEGHDDSEITGTASPELRKATANGRNGHASTENKDAAKDDAGQLKAINDTEMMLHGLNITDRSAEAEQLTYPDMQEDLEAASAAEPSSEVRSSAHMDQPNETPVERRRREHDDYKKKRDADPAFVPNRGAFFMHDHRHAGPAANGFRPFGRGRGRGRGGIGGQFAPAHHMPPPAPEPTDSRWTHDMHETVAQPGARNHQASASQFQTNGSVRGPAPAARVPPPNRALSTTKHIGNVQIRVVLPDMPKPILISGHPIKQYTRLPDHRPPLRRDKPVRISLPDHAARYIFPAIDRSFIFIPRAMRPNQQGFNARGRGRQGLGSYGGFSRRTSIYGGSVYGSHYTPSIAMSRRSSLAHEVSRENIGSPLGSTTSRPPVVIDSMKPVVRLPPSGQVIPPQVVQSIPPPYTETAPNVDGASDQQVQQPDYPPPQDPTYRENRPGSIPMHQPRPQKQVSVAELESPATLSFNPPQQQQQPFHQQVPVQVNGNGYAHDPNHHMHTRNPSYPTQISTGTPLSQIPERAIHAQPFQPTPYQAQSYYPQPHAMMSQHQGYYYPQNYNPAMAQQAGTPTFAPVQPQQSYPVPGVPDGTGNQPGGQQNLVAQEVNGMVYYYDPAQIPAVAAFPAPYTTAPSYPVQQVGGVVGMSGMSGMMTPSPDVFFYPQAPQGVMYYPQQ